MKNLFNRIKCLFGFHGKGRWYIDIIDVRYASHAVDYVQYYKCERCRRPMLEPLNERGKDHKVYIDK